MCFLKEYKTKIEADVQKWRPDDTSQKLKNPNAVTAALKTLNNYISPQ